MLGANDYYLPLLWMFIVLSERKQIQSIQAEQKQLETRRNVKRTGTVEAEHSDFDSFLCTHSIDSASFGM